MFLIEYLAVPVAGILAVSQLARLHIQRVPRNLEEFSTAGFGNFPKRWNLRLRV